MDRTRRFTGLFLLASALVAAVVVAALARFHGGADPVLVAVVGVALVGTTLLVLGDVLWHRRAGRAGQSDAHRAPVDRPLV